MSENIAKINLKIGEIEISIEGPSEFVSKQYDKVEDHLKTYSDLSKTVNQRPKTPAKNSEEVKQSNEASSNSGNSELPDSFGEYLNIIPKNTTETDKALLAGFFHQNGSESKIFKVREVSKTLKEHGVKLSNPSFLIKAATKGKKYIFQFSKDGNQANYKFSRDGEQHMNELLSGTEKE